MIGATELEALPTDALVINCARGGIVDEAALVAALKADRIAGAGFDVFDGEPPPPDHPLLTAPNTVLTPHSAAMAKEALQRAAITTVRNILDRFDGQLRPEVVVNGVAP